MSGGKYEYRVDDVGFGPFSPEIDAAERSGELIYCTHSYVEDKRQTRLKSRIKVVNVTHLLKQCHHFGAVLRLLVAARRLLRWCWTVPNCVEMMKRTSAILVISHLLNSHFPDSKSPW